MNKTQQLIKNTIETEINKQYGINVVVEYVPDVCARAKEIEEQCDIKFNSVYDSKNLTGIFIPSVKQSPYHILVQDNRKDMLDVMTAFHEYRHLCDYISFLQIVFDNDMEKMISSPLYVTFNVYSEFAATVFGVQQYIKIVRLDNLTQSELSKLVLENAKEIYQDLNNIRNRYQLLVHSVQYWGKVIACMAFIDDFKVEQYICQMELFDELTPVLDHILNYQNKSKWYEKVDVLMRTFVDGGASG